MAEMMTAAATKRYFASLGFCELGSDSAICLCSHTRWRSGLGDFRYVGLSLGWGFGEVEGGLGVGVGGVEVGDVGGEVMLEGHEVVLADPVDDTAG